MVNLNSYHVMENVKQKVLQMLVQQVESQIMVYTKDCIDHEKDGSKAGCKTNNCDNSKNVRTTDAWCNVEPAYGETECPGNNVLSKKEATMVCPSAYASYGPETYWELTYSCKPIKKFKMIKDAEHHGSAKYKPPIYKEVPAKQGLYGDNLMEQQNAYVSGTGHDQWFKDGFLFMLSLLLFIVVCGAGFCISGIGGFIVGFIVSNFVKKQKIEHTVENMNV
eukprot:513605_1